MRTLWPRSMKVWWFNRALCSLIHLSALRNLSLKPSANQHMLTLKVIEGRSRSNRNLLTVACNCSRLVIDRDTISVYFVFVTVILYYYLFIYLLFRQIVILCHTVSQKLTIISPSNFLCILSNVWRRADAKIRWPLRMTLTRDLDLTINVHFGPYLSTCWTEHLQIFTQVS